MRVIDSNTIAALYGSRSGDRLIVWPWYDGRVTTERPLDIARWAFSWDRSRVVQSIDLTIADESGALAPWLLEDPLGVGGAELQCIYQVGGAGTVNLGWYPIQESDPDSQWRSYLIDEKGTVTPDTAIPNGKRLRMASAGASITVRGEDRARKVARDQLIAPESPPAGATVISEIKRLLAGRVPVAVAGGVTDRSVNSTLVYEADRLGAVQDLCKRIGCDFRMNGDGQFEVYPLTGQSVVAALKGGPEGLLVRAQQAQSSKDLYNIFVAQGTVPETNAAVRGIAQIEAGPMRVDGPFGRSPRFYSSPMLTTQAQCDDYAQVMRDTFLAGLTTTVKVTCLPLPHIQQGDMVTVFSPRTDGGVASLNGIVSAMALSGDPTPGAMKLDVECAYQDVQRALPSGSLTSIAGAVTLAK